MAASASNNLNFTFLYSPQVPLAHETKREIEEAVSAIERVRNALIEANDNQPFTNSSTLAEAFYSNVSEQMAGVIQRSLSHLPVPTEYIDPATHAPLTKPTRHICGNQPHTYNSGSLVIDPLDFQLYCPETYIPISMQYDYALQEKIYQYALTMMGITTLPHSPTNTSTLTQLCESFEDTLSLLTIQNMLNEGAAHSASALACSGCSQGWLTLPKDQQEAIQQHICTLGARLDSLPETVQRKLFLKMYDRHAGSPELSGRIAPSLTPVQAGNDLFFDNLHTALSVLAETLMEEILHSQIPTLELFKNDDALIPLLHDGALTESLHELNKTIGLIKTLISN